MVDMISTNGNTGLRSGYLPKVETLDTYNDESMLQDLVEIMSTQADFAHLSSKEYDLELREATKIEETDEDYFSDDSDDSPVPPCYTPETQMNVLRWRPRLWWIPDRKDLKSVLEFLYIWPTAPPDPPVDDAWIPRMYFSAAAVATRFLEGLSPHVCKHLRKIIITEDRLSVASPIAHGQAFIPFCIANPSLRVERRVDIWYTEFVHRSDFFREDTSGTIAWIATWINEVKILYQKAIWQDGAMEIARREQRQFDDDDGVAEDFVDVIKDMLRGEIPARFDADMGELWDIEKLLRENDGDWPTDVRDVFRLQDFDEPDGGWEAAREVYTEDVAWMDRVNGWRRLAGEEPL
ncbi:uncharacterized protein J4E78_001310 [Alternaria triticimaculans]|uniref:uncharacterized protein n=1 Tax=Alternaria triticimaculans TaxID=297637 RepID=UPI0020C57E6C|nr:uncharacterized protein J4E78_001310 [Alternaria triticimaculans]KAI4672807.1 hypothetical protein J4E78_001310 [Alternaria triticimaculans]